jgi:hypothetical protein
MSSYGYADAPRWPAHPSTRYGTPAPRFCSPRGVRSKVEQEMLGHSTIVITMDLDSQSAQSLQDHAAHRLDDALRGPLKGNGATRA